MRVTFLRRTARAVLVVRPHVVLQGRDVEAKHQFFALNRVVLAAPSRNVALVTAVAAARLTRRRAHVGHGVIVFMTGAASPGRRLTFVTADLLAAALQPGTWPERGSCHDS
jgi:hypothetical protein